MHIESGGAFDMNRVGYLFCTSNPCHNYVDLGQTAQCNGVGECRYVVDAETYAKSLQEQCNLELSVCFVGAAG